MDDERVIKSYVWHGDKCFFVSTIERDSSAVEGPVRFNETIVWDYDYAGRTRGDLIHTAWDAKGSITAHHAICGQLYRTGLPDAMKEKSKCP